MYDIVYQGKLQKDKSFPFRGKFHLEDNLLEDNLLEDNLLEDNLCLGDNNIRYIVYLEINSMHCIVYNIQSKVNRESNFCVKFSDQNYIIF